MITLLRKVLLTYLLNNKTRKRVIHYLNDKIDIPGMNEKEEQLLFNEIWETVKAAILA